MGLFIQGVKPWVPVSISVAVCGHYKRREMSESLASQLDCPISMDVGTRGSIANHDATLRLAAEADADWLIAIEDDAQPVADFYDQAERALRECPAPIASLYFGYVGKRDPGMDYLLRTQDRHWIMGTGLANAVCLAVHRTFYPQLMSLCTESNDLPADHRYSEAALQLGYDWVPHAYPSLVEHADVDSLIAGRPTPDFERKAYAVGGREVWSKDSKQWLT